MPLPPPDSAGSPYIVFFDAAGAELTERGRQIVQEAADAGKRRHPERIEVDGHSDTAHTPNHDVALSRRMAETVAAALVADGVPRSVIHIRAYADKKPLVPTGPHADEPQNRRVEIILRNPRR